MNGKMWEVVFELLDVFDRFWGKDDSKLVERMLVAVCLRSQIQNIRSEV